jgi:hypothetical protein
MAFIRPAIAEVWNHGGDALDGGAAAGIREDEQLDQMIVDRRRKGLDDEDLSLPHGLQQAH